MVRVNAEDTLYISHFLVDECQVPQVRDVPDLSLLNYSFLNQFSSNPSCARIKSLIFHVKYLWVSKLQIISAL